MAKLFTKSVNREILITFYQSRNNRGGETDACELERLKCEQEVIAKEIRITWNCKHRENILMKWWNDSLHKTCNPLLQKTEKIKKKSITHLTMLAKKILLVICLKKWATEILIMTSWKWHWNLDYRRRQSTTAHPCATRPFTERATTLQNYTYT